ncbi:MAG: ARMT1-like domain-containing protein [Methanoregula sp.]|nr:ARMT1-like domain-containing protein [Methanoregula sp.]
MKITGTCIECLISRVRLECTLAHADAQLTEKTISSCGTLLSSLRTAPLSHPQIASRIHRRAYDLLGNPDPFFELKKSGNEESMEVCRKVKKDLVTFRDYVLAAVIANTFDYGVKGHTVTDNFADFFRKEFEKGLTIDDTDRIVPLCSRVVYLSDNCGEIVFDRLLIQYLKSQGAHVTLAVKEIPMLNDAMLKDARMLGLDHIVDLLTTNGNRGEIGICLEDIPADLTDAIERCTLIIAKGMANFESLSELTELPPVAYLMATKCQPVADEVGVPVGSKIAMLRC